MSLLSPPLQAFVSVVRQGTVHGAAESLHLTPTGVTQRIRSLEKELATTLFLRSRKGMKLTAEGEALWRYCQGALDLEGRAVSQIHKAGQEQPAYVTVVGPTSVLTARLIEQCAPLYALWPHLYLNFHISDALDRLQWVRSGQAALAVVPPEQVPQEMDSKRLKPDRYVLVATPQWRGRRLSDILEQERAIDFEESDPTTIHYLKKFGLLSHLKRPRLYVNNNEAIAKLFCRGVGYGTLTQEIAKPYLNSGRLITLNSGALMEERLALVWYPRSGMPKYFRAIIEAIG